jgi:hypothetical protein
MPNPLAMAGNEVVKYLKELDLKNKANWKAWTRFPASIKENARQDFVLLLFDDARIDHPPIQFNHVRHPQFP